jgi:hypothetical protein
MQFRNGKLFVPFTKVDQEKRMVWGIAQTEDPDCQDDLLDYEASVRAFTKWSGNIWEMHDSRKAVGRRVEIKCDPVTKQVAVGAYISKGAEDTWQKVLDGTLNGWSVGGYPIRTGSINKNGRRLRHITEYAVDELSLVDAPANPHCVINAIQKRGNTLIATDVLGALRPGGTTMRNKRAKVQSLVTFAKGLGADDELVVLRQSDFRKTADGSFVLKADAAIAAFKKGDLDADGYNDSSDDVAPEDSIGGVTKQDMGEHAQNALNAHDDWHSVAGDDSCKCDRDDDAPEMKGPDEADPDAEGMGKNAARRRRKDALRKRQAAMGLSTTEIDRTLTERFAEFAKSFDAKFEQLGVKGGDPAPRKNADGTLVKRDADGSGGTDDKDPIAINTAKLTTAYAQREAFLKKGSQGLSSQDRSERETLAKEIGSLEIEHLALTGSQAR